MLSVAKTNARAAELAPSAVCGILSSMYLCKPTAESILTWRNVMSEGVPDYAGGLKKAVGSIDLRSAREMENLLWDYTRLLVGPYRLPCPPWESVYTSSKRLLLQEASDAVRAAYEEIGLEVGASRVLPDHIGIELNFMGVLLEKIEADSGGDNSRAKCAKEFFNAHLQSWVPRFAADMERAAETPLYKAVARSTTATLNKLGQVLD